MVYGYDRIWQLIDKNYIELTGGAKTIYNSHRGSIDDFVSSCNCDLRIGDNCYLSDSLTGNHSPFLKAGETISIPSMGIMLFETEAIFHIPDSYAFRLSLRMSFYKKGLFMPNLPLCKPGYNGRLYGVIMNISSEPVKIHYRERMLTLEVVGIDNSSDNSLLSNTVGGEKEGSMGEFARNAIKSTFRKELKKSEELLIRLTKERNDFKETIEHHTKKQMESISHITTIVGVITFIVAVITLNTSSNGGFIDAVIRMIERFISWVKSL